MRTTNHRIRRACAAACAAPLLVVGVAATAGAAQATASPASVPRAVQASTPGEILALVNQARAQAGCDPLKEDPRLMAAAQAHADDMTKNNITSHTGSDGSSYLDRMQKAGYNPQGPSSENMSWGHPNAKSHVDGWLNSTKGHREAMLNCTYVETGIGTSGDNAVQLFAVKSS
jgi:uncharacterized protein YkwD